MLGSNPSADSVASTDPGGCCAIPLSSVCWHRARIGRGTKAQNPGGAGAKPLRHSLLPLRKPASSHNACIIAKSRNIKGAHVAVGCGYSYHHLPKGAPL